MDLLSKALSFVLAVGFAGSLVDATRSMMNKAAVAHEIGLMSYSAWTQSLLSGKVPMESKRAKMRH